MAKYSIDFEYKEPHWGNVEIDANDADQAEFLARNHVMDLYDDISDVLITEVKHIGE